MGSQYGVFYSFTRSSGGILVMFLTRSYAWSVLRMNASLSSAVAAWYASKGLSP